MSCAHAAVNGLRFFERGRANIVKVLVLFVSMWLLCRRRQSERVLLYHPKNVRPLKSQRVAHCARRCVMPNREENLAHFRVGNDIKHG
jgi:hypothetical protein